MRVNYDNFLKLVAALVDQINNAASDEDYNKALGAALAFRELLLMEAGNLNEQLVKPLHGKVMQSFLQPSNLIVPPEGLSIPIKG